MTMAAGDTNRSKGGPARKASLAPPCPPSGGARRFAWNERKGLSMAFAAGRDSPSTEVRRPHPSPLQEYSRERRGGNFDPEATMQRIRALVDLGERAGAARLAKRRPREVPRKRATRAVAPPESQRSEKLQSRSLDSSARAPSRPRRYVVTSAPGSPISFVLARRDDFVDGLPGHVPLHLREHVSLRGSRPPPKTSPAEPIFGAIFLVECPLKSGSRELESQNGCIGPSGPSVELADGLDIRSKHLSQVARKP
jgi:hypothetical protein